MRKLKLLGLFVAGLMVGYAASNWWSTRVFWSTTIAKEADFASMAAFESEWLAGLRLNEQEDVVKQMESWMSGTVLTLAQYENAKPADEKTRQMRDHFLVPVKVYFESYPPAADQGAAMINAFLATVPGRSANSTCGSAICRLDDLHRGAPGVKTGSASK
jgi:hypothetical protein